MAGCQSVTGGNDGLGGTPSPEAFVASNDPAYLGREHFTRANYALAEENFRKAVELKPNDAASWVGLAASYDQLGRFDLADRAYEKATQLSGNTFEILNNRGFSYMLRGDNRQATVMFKRAKSLRPNDPVVSNNLLLLTQART
ncbi:hypothetical protein DC522_04960 [Microvirga sp. KLBC 81]|nr:hypothetical protein DC522_04960 [Microvirga sp. KLBC 81]